MDQDLIRIVGRDMKSGARTVTLVLAPQMVARMAETPIAVPMRDGHEDIVSAQLDVIIYAPKDYVGVAAMIAKAAGEAQIAPTVVAPAKAPTVKRTGKKKNRRATR